MKYMKILIFTLLCVIISFSIYKILNVNQNNTINYYVFDTDNVLQVFQMLFEKYNVKQTDILTNANIIFFKLLVDYRNYYNLVNNLPYVKYIYSIYSIDLFASKSILYSMLKNNSKIKNIDNISPKTYIIANKEDFKEMLDSYNESKLYILKKNIQRQKGCLITNKYEDLKNSKKNQYVVCQDLLQNPYTINGHKINIRMYMLLIIKDELEMYIYNNGFMYYTPEKYKKNSLDKDVNITTGYIDRKIYDKNPLTLYEFYEYIGKKKEITYKKNIKKLFKNIYDSYKTTVEKYDKSNKTNFVIMGCDIAVSKEMNTQIMEINKGPDLNFKDKKDGYVKYNLIKDSFKIVGIIPNDNNVNFIKIS